MESENTSRENFVNEVEGWKRVLIWVFAKFLRVWQKTLRMEIDEETRKLMKELPEGALFVLWHNRIFLGTEFYKRTREHGHDLYCLVSASRDGAVLTAFFRDMGFDVVRGSSSRRGMQALRSLLKVLRARNDVGITVDGPRGPCYQAHSGASLLAMQTKAPVILFSSEIPKGWRFNSWDRFILPYPFSRVKINMDYLPPFSTMAGEQGRQVVQETIQRRLSAITPELVSEKD